MVRGLRELSERIVEPAVAQIINKQIKSTALKKIKNLPGSDRR